MIRLIAAMVVILLAPSSSFSQQKCSLFSGYWVADTGIRQNGFPWLATSDVRTVRNQSEMQSFVAQCLNINGQQVQQIVNWGANKGAYQPYCGQTVTYCR